MQHSGGVILEWFITGYKWTGNNYTETERSSLWLPWTSWGTLKLAFNVSSDDQDSHPDDRSIPVYVLLQI